MDKIALLSEALARNPSDAFARYGLAMEYVSRGETETALAEFARLLADHPDYAQGYFMSAQALAKLRRNDEAKARLTAGIAVAGRAGNQHAQHEMQALLDDLEMDD